MSEQAVEDAFAQPAVRDTELLDRPAAVDGFEDCAPGDHEVGTIMADTGWAARPCSSSSRNIRETLLDHRNGSDRPSTLRRS